MKVDQLTINQWGVKKGEGGEGGILEREGREG